jgi:hypothetical protein
MLFLDRENDLTQKSLYIVFLVGVYTMQLVGGVREYPLQGFQFSRKYSVYI